MTSSKACHACASEAVEAKASIDTLTAGIEYCDTYLLCTPCNSWTQLTWKDSWTGSSTIFRTTISSSHAERDIELIEKCPSPSDAWCECPSHQSLQRG